MDRILSVAEGVKASAKKWKNKEYTWAEFAERLSSPVVTPEKYRDFMASGRASQAKIKDQGGFFGGYLDNGSRKRESVRLRSLLCLDMDFSVRGADKRVAEKYGVAFVMHSTHKSSPLNPRHRLIIPLLRDVTPDEYEPLARRVADSIGMELFDPTTFDVNRLMFFPSVSSDMEYEYVANDGPWLDPDAVLATYRDWRDASSWPSDGESDVRVRSEAEKAEDPTEKSGLIGAFCRTYTVEDAMEKFLPGEYEPCGEGRYTYLKGSTQAGLVIYNDGKFAYSHHATDPTSGRLCNAYDFVRLHKYGALDPEGSEKASTSAMDRLAANDPDTKGTIAAERAALAREAFGDAYRAAGAGPEEDTEWRKGLTVNKSGVIESTANNLNLIVRNDPVLKGCMSVNRFDCRRYMMRSTPWRTLSGDGPEPVRDLDYSGVRNYIECAYQITGTQKIDDAVAIEVERTSFHPVKDYLKSLEWDGTPRVDTLLVDYLGVEDSPYARAAIRKALCAAVARVFRPGTKYDMALVLVGPQGTYKSTFLRKLGRQWFSDSFSTVQGKEAYEQLQGAWIIEMAELSALKRSESEQVKQFMSKCEDQFRPAYGRTVEVFPRQCVFFGTTNDFTFLKDPTGNRRFNPVDVDPSRATKSVRDDMDAEVDQIWAEAVVLYSLGEELYFTDEVARAATEEQGCHSTCDERTGVLEDFLDIEVPADWSTFDLARRRAYMANVPADPTMREKNLRRRDEVCVAELWCECFGNELADMTRYNTRDLNDFMRSVRGWAPAGSRKMGPYGKQRIYRRITQ